MKKNVYTIQWQALLIITMILHVIILYTVYCSVCYSLGGSVAWFTDSYSGQLLTDTRVMWPSRYRPGTDRGAGWNTWLVCWWSWGLLVWREDRVVRVVCIVPAGILPPWIEPRYLTGVSQKPYFKNSTYQLFSICLKGQDHFGRGLGCVVILPWSNSKGGQEI